MKISDYCVIDVIISDESSIDVFEERIINLIKKGWQLHGNLVATTETESNFGRLFQVLVKQK